MTSKATKYIEAREKNDYKGIYALKSFNPFDTVAADETNIYVNVVDFVIHYPELGQIAEFFDVREFTGLVLLSQCPNVPQWWLNLFPRKRKHPFIAKIVRKIKTRRALIDSIPMFQSFKELSDKWLAFLLLKIGLNYYKIKVKIDGIKKMVINLPVSLHVSIIHVHRM